jgi:hypothetical protein
METNRCEYINNFLRVKLRENNYRLMYTCYAYSMYTGYGLCIGIFQGISESKIVPVIYGFLIGSIFGILVGFMVYIKHPIFIDFD